MSTQAERVIEFIEKHGSITDLDAFSDLGVRRLSARIFELRAKGNQIISSPEKITTRYGTKTTIARYRLAEAAGNAPAAWNS